MVVTSLGSGEVKHVQHKQQHRPCFCVGIRFLRVRKGGDLTLHSLLLATQECTVNVQNDVHGLSEPLLRDILLFDFIFLIFEFIFF